MWYSTIGLVQVFCNSAKFRKSFYTNRTLFSGNANKKGILKKKQLNFTLTKNILMVPSKRQFPMSRSKLQE